VASAENQLLASLPRKDANRILVVSEPVALALSDSLSESGAPTRYVYFPTAGFISLVAQIEDHPGLEVGMVGSEGMLGVQIALGVATAPLHALVQGPGAAWRLPVSAFRRELAASVALRRAMNRYISVLMSQLVASAACQRFHLVGPRLARWLLMSQDRSRSDHFHVTHEFLSYMLGVRRVGITMAAGEFARDGLIRYHRGELQVIDRKGLEAASCSCYLSDQLAYRQIGR
jgi:CRP-like cAMP-binding protein